MHPTPNTQHPTPLPRPKVSTWQLQLSATPPPARGVGTAANGFVPAAVAAAAAATAAPAASAAAANGFVPAAIAAAAAAAAQGINLGPGPARLVPVLLPQQPLQPQGSLSRPLRSFAPDVGGGWSSPGRPQLLQPQQPQQPQQPLSPQPPPRPPPLARGAAVREELGTWPRGAGAAGAGAVGPPARGPPLLLCVAPPPPPPGAAAAGPDGGIGGGGGGHSGPLARRLLGRGDSFVRRSVSSTGADHSPDGARAVRDHTTFQGPVPLVEGPNVLCV
jgi:hypothetical protein